MKKTAPDGAVPDGGDVCLRVSMDAGRPIGRITCQSSFRTGSNPEATDPAPVSVMLTGALLFPLFFLVRTVSLFSSFSPWPVSTLRESGSGQFDPRQIGRTPVQTAGSSLPFHTGGSCPGGSCPGDLNSSFRHSVDCRIGAFRVLCQLMGTHAMRLAFRVSCSSTCRSPSPKAQFPEILSPLRCRRMARDTTLTHFPAYGG